MTKLSQSWPKKPIGYQTLEVNKHWIDKGVLAAPAVARHIVGDVLVLRVDPVKSLALCAMVLDATEKTSADARQDTKTAPPAVEAVK